MLRVFGILLIALGGLAAARAPGRDAGGEVAGARTARRTTARPTSAFALFALPSHAWLDVNRVRCAISDVGEQCVDPTNSSVVGGGFWPAGTPDQYIFNGGPVVAAILGGSRSSVPPFPWAGDTVGAFIFDERGDQASATALTGVWNSRDPSHLADWPGAAFVRDPALFDASLLGLEAASEQDTWMRYWDAARAPGDSAAWPWGSRPRRPHPMGLLVDQRTLAWNRPAANADIVYVIHRIINISARAASRYAGLAAAGYSAEAIAEIARLGAAFQDSVEAYYGVDLPDTGYTWTRLYLGVGQDPDVGQSGMNYSTTVLPFALALAYKSDFREPSWLYPADVFAPPFAAAPGLVGTRFLRAASGPVTDGSAVTLFTNMTGGAPFPSRVGVQALWRMLSANILPTDGTCSMNPVTQHVCQQVQAPVDTRWYQSSGPFLDLHAGESLVFAVAFLFAAPVGSALTLPGAYPDYKPGDPSMGTHLAAGTEPRQIERVAGWLDSYDTNRDGDVQIGEVRTVPYSLLHKAQVAQAFFDARFVAARAPSAPRFAVLPGDRQATVVWEKSVSETVGDPYFPLASDPLGALYDPNFRQFDVEGYRVWRGTSLATMQVVAQFDYSGTALTDATGQIYGDFEQVGQCAPDLGVVADCRADFAHGASRSIPLAGTVVQIPPGGRAVLADGRVMVTRADTVVTGGGSSLPPLRDTGVPFAFVDTGLANGETYVYAVTAFDVNSINSATSSMERAPLGRTVTPRAGSSNLRTAAVTIGMFGGDGARLDPHARFPDIDPDNGTFNGPIPPANGWSLDLPVPVQELLPAGEYTIRIDSVSAGFPEGFGSPLPRIFFSALGGPEVLDGDTTIVAWYHGSPDETRLNEYTVPLIPPDSARLRRFGVQVAPDWRILARFAVRATSLSASSPGVARASVFGSAGAASRWLAHSRWYDGAAGEPPDPTLSPFATRAHTNGSLQAATAIYSPIAYRLPRTGGAATRAIPTIYRTFVHATIAAWYPADIVVTWGNGGTITVRDSTHRVGVPFKRAIQPGYGFLNASGLVAAGVTAAQLSDGAAGVTFDPAVVSYYSLRVLRPVCAVSGFGATCVDLDATARLQPIDVTNDGVSDGTGIALLVNGEPFYMLMNALPPVGTVWRLRAVGGGTLTASCGPPLPSQYDDMLPGGEPTDCDHYAYDPPETRPAYAPGLRFTVRVVQQAGPDTTAYADLSGIHTVPDPFYFTNAIAPGVLPALRFVGLPERAVVRIYTASGILVTMLTHNDATGGGEEAWDLRNRGGAFVASGVYFYHVETPDHRTKIGRFTIVQQAWP